MTATLQFVRNVAVFVIMFVFLCAFIVVWWLAVIFHGVNYLSGARR